MQKNNHVNADACDCSSLVELTRLTSITQLNEFLLLTIGRLLPENKITFSNDIEQQYSLISSQKYLGLLVNNKKLESLIEEKSISPTVVKELDSLIEVYINQSNMISNVNHDQLTKLGNRQALDAKFLDIFGISGRRKNEASYCLAILDIDHFKQVNDNYGHLHGDEVLLQLSRLMIETFRDIDFLFRFGGEEFVVILSDIQLAQAKRVLDRFREKVSQYQFPLVEKVTISIGLTQVTLDSNAMEILEQADKALYFAKDKGRNQLRLYEELIASGDLKAKDIREDDITLF
jgi:diguanylate cyclase (GGDEF)-like protein